MPFELKNGKDGSFSYRSLLLSVSGNKTEEGKQHLVINLFNLPDCLKKKPAQELPNEQEPAEAAEITAEEAPEPEEPAAESES